MVSLAPSQSPSRRSTPTDTPATSPTTKEIHPLVQGKAKKGLPIPQMMTAIHRARLCTSQAITQAPAPPAQDPDAASGEGRGGGAQGTPAAASAQAEPAQVQFEVVADDGAMEADAPETNEQQASIAGEVAMLQAARERTRKRNRERDIRAYEKRTFELDTTVAGRA